MGYEFEVAVWTWGVNGYQWRTKYEGSDEKAAFKTLTNLKKNGYKCVRLTWR